jgi:hypothetical protein
MRVVFQRDMAACTDIRRRLRKRNIESRLTIEIPKSLEVVVAIPVRTPDAHGIHTRK